MMKTRMRGVLALGVGVLLAAAAHGTVAAQADELSVTVNYAGKGTVDANHRIWIWLFTSPDIGPGSLPIAEASLAENGGTATFKPLGAAQVWIAVTYDERGGFMGSEPPPPGVPVGMYGDTPGVPAPARAGSAVKVTFDDSMRMP